MPPKAAPQPIQQPQVLQDTLGMNLEYLLPHQRDQYRKAFQTMNDLQSRKAKDPDNAVLDNAIAEARKQLSTLAQQASNQQKVFPTPELFKAFATKAHQIATQRSQNPAAVSAAVSSPDHIRKLHIKALQVSNRLTEIENTLGGPADLSEDTKNNLRAEYQNIYSQQEIAREILRLAAVQMQSSRVAQASGNTAGGQTETTNTQAQAPAPSQQPATPPISQPATPRNIASLPATAQALPTPTQSMGSIPRPSVITGNQPVRPTLSGGFSVGNPLLGTSTPVSLPNAFQLAQDGETRLLSKRKLQDLARSIDPDERLEPDVEDVYSSARIKIDNSC
jgi:Transcription initiation factor TFIID subunit A